MSSNEKLLCIDEEQMFSNEKLLFGNDKLLCTYEERVFSNEKLLLSNEKLFFSNKKLLFVPRSNHKRLLMLQFMFLPLYQWH